MKLYNSLTKKTEEFEPIKPPHVGMYTCGPTVYDFAHIGHGRKYVNDDVLKRTLTYLGYEVEHVENITDVGHLVSDADSGEDKMEKGAVKAGKTVWEVAQFFIDDFRKMIAELNIISPDVLARATDNIPEQIAMIKTLVEKRYAYETDEAVYFDVGKFEDYGKLFGQDLSEKEVAVRETVQTGEFKKNPYDFALWFKRTGRFANHQMHWDSPWGDGFPGWHIECSAMSVKYLGDQFDIHTGGEDHLPIHHPNEIAQSEAATGKKPFVKYWVHHAFLKVEGKKMSKSFGNFLRVEDITKRGYRALALRYLYLSTHYRKTLNFTWEGLAGAESALNRLIALAQAWSNDGGRTQLSAEKLEKVDQYRDNFRAAIEDDMNMPQALAALWEMCKSNIPDYDKYELLLNFDEVLGLGLSDVRHWTLDISQEAKDLLLKREELRAGKKFEEADKIREELENMGYQVLDTVGGAKLVKKRAD